MARDLYGRVQLRCAVVAETGIHVGGLGTSASTDLVLARDGLGRPCILGRSLFGPLSHWWLAGRDITDPAVDDSLRAFLGFVVGDQGAASWVTIDDAVLCADDKELADLAGNPLGFRSAIEQRIDLHVGVGIDRARGAAARHILHDMEAVPRSARFWLTLTASAPTEEVLERHYRYLRALGEALERQEVRCGRRKSAGWGRLAFFGEARRALHVEPLHDRRAMLAALRRRIQRPAPGGAAAPAADERVTQWEASYEEEGASLPPRRRLLRFTLQWTPTEPITIGAGLDGTVVDKLPLFTRRADGTYEPRIPGTSIKGALRSRAEFRLRSALGLDAPTPDGSSRFLDQLRQLALINRLFGEAGRDDEEGTALSQGAGALIVDPVFSEPEHRLDETQWQRLFEAAVDDAPARLDAELRDTLRSRGYEPLMQNSIDRWTGGAADRRLFSVLRAERVTWSPIELTLDLDQLGDLAGAGLALVLQLLRDLGWARDPLEPTTLDLGGGALRGGGGVRLEAVLVRTAGSTAALPLQHVGRHPAELTRRMVDVPTLDGALRAALAAEPAHRVEVSA